VQRQQLLRRFALRHPQAAAAGACAAGELAAGDEAIVVQVQGAEVGGTGHLILRQAVIKVLVQLIESLVDTLQVTTSHGLSGHGRP